MGCTLGLHPICWRRIALPYHQGGMRGGWEVELEVVFVSYRVGCRDEGCWPDETESTQDVA